MLTAGEDDWLAVAGNLRNARKSWARMTRILGWEGQDLKILGLLFKAVIQEVLLFGSETWVLTSCMEWDLDSLQNRDAQQITGGKLGGGKTGISSAGGSDGGSGF